MFQYLLEQIWFMLLLLVEALVGKTAAVALVV
jgi:hypothetical protein